jgi:hypothetical protein
VAVVAVVAVVVILLSALVVEVKQLHEEPVAADYDNELYNNICDDACNNTFFFALRKKGIVRSSRR